MFTALLDLLLPSVCPACRVSAGPDLCAACLHAVVRLHHPCPWCATPRPSKSAPCRNCAGRGLPNIQEVAIACSYEGVIEDLVRAAKAGARPAAVRVLTLLTPALENPHPATVVVPLPPSPGRRSGPHLATALAWRIARVHGLRARQLLLPTRAAAEQHRLAARERERNVDGLFACRGAAPEHVVLVDDLLTSGATATAAASAMRAGGARRITLACLARTPRGDDARPILHAAGLANASDHSAPSSIEGTHGGADGGANRSADKGEVSDPGGIAIRPSSG